MTDSRRMVGLVGLHDPSCGMRSVIEIVGRDGRRTIASLREAVMMDVAPTVENPTAVMPMRKGLSSDDSQG